MAASNKSASKKRKAAPETVTNLKKARAEKNSNRAADNVDRKRSRPVTEVHVVDDRSDSEQEDPGVDHADEIDDGEGGEAYEEEIAEDEQMKIDGINIPSKDPNASRESHKVQRALLNERRSAKPHSTLLTSAKRVWALLRQKNIPSAQRQKHIHDLMEIIRGHVKDVVLKHDASRIVQSVVKYGGQKERDEIASELKGSFKQLAQNKYSKFLVTKLIRFCPTHRPVILLEFQSHVLRLLLHREASSVLADAFELHANAYERAILVRDFYGKETALFSVTTGSDEDKERAKRGLKGVLEGVEGERRKRIMGAVKDNLVTLFNNPDKGAVTHAIVHRALWEYFCAVNDMTDEAEREKLRREIFESCQEVLAELVHTKDGSRVVREFIAQGTAKDRKQILKVLKPHIERMCTNDEAQLVLFTALDVIDDTKLTAKSILGSITANARTLCTTPQGRRSLLYPLVPRSRRHFTPAQIALLAETDAVCSRAGTSKKDEAARGRVEVRRAVSPALVEFVGEQGATVLQDPGGSLVVLEIMLYAEGDKTEAIETLLKPLAQPYPSLDPSTPHIIDLPHASRMYKTLLQGGHYSHSTRTIECAPASTFTPMTFASAFMKTVGRDGTIAIACGEGAFVVAELCECVRIKGEEGEMELIKEWFNDGVVRSIEECEARGKNVLLEKIRSWR